MCRYKVAIILLYSSSLLTPQAQAKHNETTLVNAKAGGPTITVTTLDVGDNILRLRYDIANTSDQNIWILAGGGKANATVEVFMDKDDQTLLVRDRLDLPMEYTALHNVNGRYVLLRAGQTRRESITLTVPVWPEFVFWGGRTPRGIEYATRLVIEIGYYYADLPEMIWGLLRQADVVARDPNNPDEMSVKDYFKGPLQFNRENEVLRERDEEILIPHTDQKLKGERVLRTIAEGLRLPYEEKIIFNEIPMSLSIPPCTRVEIQYTPSMLEYFYPYTGQRQLLSAEERQALQSVKTIVVENRDEVESFINDTKKGLPTWLIVRETNVAQVACYREAERVASFRIYDGDSVVAYERGRFVYRESPPDLRKLSPQIKPFELRIQCAANLRNLWHRLRLYDDAKGAPRARRSANTEPASSANTEMSYPAPTHWCAGLVSICKTIQMRDDEIIGPHICPGTGERKEYLADNDYAMNPNCRYDSPPDMVLLFETKAGWNQHGGPELFTFDNHDPKGGCVLLNDGTVKFIRTQEELQQLRWK
jgi:hypothetical protein